MALLRRLFYRKPPDRLLEISERVYVFDSCFSTDVLEEDKFKVYLDGIVAQLQAYYPDASFMVFNFKEGEVRCLISDILSQYDMTVMDYPRQYEGCPVLPLEMIHHFLRSSESWLSSQGPKNVLLMHCERGGWPVLAFMLAGLLLYRKQYSGEKKTLDMVYKQAPRELLNLFSPLNPQPSQMRYLQYISERNLGPDWPPSDTPLVLDCLILRVLPLFDGGRGCRPIVRVYGQDTSLPENRNSKLFFSNSKTKKGVRHYSQAESLLVKIDIHCRVQGDVVIECIHLDEDLIREEMMFRVMFHTAFVRSNILMFNPDEIDIMWDARDRFPKDFRSEVLFMDADAAVPDHVTVAASGDKNEVEIASPEEYYEVGEIFSDVVDMLEQKRNSDTPVINGNKSHSLDHKIYLKEDPSKPQDSNSDHGNHKQVVKVDCNADAVKDITVDDVKYRRVKSVDSDLHAMKDIGVDDGTIKRNSLLFSQNLEETEDTGDGTVTDMMKLESKALQKKLTADGYRQKSEYLQSPACRKQLASAAKPIADISLPKQKVKQQETQGFLAKQAKPNAVSRWIPPNKGSYANSMHVYYPPSRNINASATLSKDSNANSKLKTTSGTTAPGLLALTDMGSKQTSHKVNPMELSVSPTSIPPHISLQSEVGPPLSNQHLPPSSPPPAPPVQAIHSSSLSAFCIPPNAYSSHSLFEATPYPQPSLPTFSNAVSKKIPSLSPSPPASLSLLPPEPPLTSNTIVLDPSSPPVSPSRHKNVASLPPPPPPWKYSGSPIASNLGTSSPATSTLVKVIASPSSLSYRGPRHPPPSNPLTSFSRATSSSPAPSAPVCRTPPPPPPPLPPIHGRKPALLPLILQAPILPPPSLLQEAPPTPPPPPPIHGGKPSLPPPPSPPHGVPTPPSPPIRCAPPPPPPIGGGLSPPLLGACVPGPPIPPGGASPPPLPFGAKVGAPPPPPPLGSKGGAPPPPAPGLSAGRGRVPSRPSGIGSATTPQRYSLKPLHWSKVTRVLQGSLWEELQQVGEPQIASDFDVSELESLFSASVPKAADVGGKSGARHKSSGSKTDKIQLIDLRRAYNTEIMLTKVKMPLADMMTAILAMDESVLDVDQVENLSKFCPTKEEMELLKGYTGNKDDLGKCEKYFMELMKVPRVESKLRVFSFKIQFRLQISEFRKSLNTLNSACEEVRNSMKLKEVMKKILYLGNTLNQGTARGSALGFKLDSLLKLTDTRASNSKMTLMHYLCKVLASKSPALLDFYLDLGSLEAASRIQLKSVAEEMQAIIKGLEKVRQELVSSESDGPVSELFCKTLKEFTGIAETEVASVTNLYSVAGRNADALALYFGEDPARCPFEQVAVTLINFVRMFRRAHEENIKQAELEKKKAEKEAEMEKAKASTSQRKV